MINIMETLGKLDDSESDFIENPKAKKLVNLAKSSAPPINFKTEFSKSSAAIIELLERMLKFNPQTRSSASELLDSPVFKNFNKRQCKSVKEVVLWLDGDGIFNYDTSKFEWLNFKDLNEILINEL